MWLVFGVGNVHEDEGELLTRINHWNVPLTGEIARQARKNGGLCSRYFIFVVRAQSSLAETERQKYNIA